MSKNNPSDASLDKDSDGLDNLQESILGLNPTSKDSDEDGLSDGDEFALYKTNPTLEDTDDDGINDGDELNGDPATNPLNADTDSDGLEDGEEINGDPATNPTLADSDNDGVIDILEIEADTDPTDSKSTPPLGSPIVHFDATSLELEDGAVVELWDGKTAEGDPVYLKNQSPGGGPAVQFNGDDHFGEAILESSDSGDFIVMAVVKPDQHGPSTTSLTTMTQTDPCYGWIVAVRKVMRLILVLAGMGQFCHRQTVGIWVGISCFLIPGMVGCM